jgi:hypothetical protein
MSTLCSRTFSSVCFHLITRLSLLLATALTLSPAWLLAQPGTGTIRGVVANAST